MNCFGNTLTLALTASILAGTMLAQPPAGRMGSQRVPPAPEVERGPRQQRKIALTFDAGEGNEDLPTLLRVLEHENVIATFFLTGRWAGEFPACASQIVTQGHVIGNHTWSYKDLTKLSDTDVAQELLRADDRFVSLFGCRYLPLFRAPFQGVDDRVLRIVEKLGFRAVRWSIDTLDSVESRQTASVIEQQVLDRSDEELCGAIVRMHVGSSETCAALPVVIDHLRERGFEFVPVAAFVPMPESALTNLHETLPPHPPAYRTRGLGWGGGFSFDDRATNLVLSTSCSSAPEPQIPARNWRRWSALSGIISDHHNTPTMP